MRKTTVKRVDPAVPRRWASLKEAAEYMSVHPKTITRKFSEGALIRYRLGRRVMVDLDELDELVLSSAGGLKTLIR